MKNIKILFTFIIVITIGIVFLVKEEYFFVENKDLETNSININDLLALNISKNLEIDMGLSNYSIHESEDLEVVITIKNNWSYSTKALVNIKSGSRAVVAFSKDRKLEDSYKYEIYDAKGAKISDKKLEVATECVSTDCALYNEYNVFPSNSTNPTASAQEINYKIGAIPGKSKVIFKVHLKDIGQVGQDTMRGVYKKIEVKAYETDSFFHKTADMDPIYKKLTYNIAKSMHRQDISLLDKKDGKVIYDLHDLEAVDGFVTAYLRVRNIYNEEIKSNDDFIKNTYHSEKVDSNVSRPTESEEYNFYKDKNDGNFALEKPTDITSKLITGNNSNITTANNKIEFKLENKADEEYGFELKIPVKYLNRTICFQPKYDKAGDDVNTFVLDDSGLSGINTYCVGPKLHITNVAAQKVGISEDRKKANVNLFINLKNKDLSNGPAEGNGLAKNAKVTYILPDDVDVSESLLKEKGISYDKENNKVTANVSSMYYNATGQVIIPVIVDNSKTSLTIKAGEISVEDSEYAGNTINYSSGLLGDWNRNFVVDGKDLVYARRHMAGDSGYGKPSAEIYDFDKNGKLEANDISKLAIALVDGTFDIYR